MTVHDLENLFLQRLAIVYDEGEAEAITSLVLEELFRKPKSKMMADRGNHVAPHIINDCEKILTRLEMHEPVQYVLGTAWFCGMRIRVNRSVLIPRPETEELVYIIVSATENKRPRILDIGTGSGCIALALKKILPDATVTGVDISEEALGIARKNANENLLAVNFHQLDVLNYHLHLDFSSAYEKFDIIVSNPPYITLSEKLNLHKNVTAFEPHGALFVPDDDALLFYREIARFSESFLTEKGKLFFEINREKAVEVVQLMKDKGYQNTDATRDISGNFRFVAASRF